MPDRPKLGGISPFFIVEDLETSISFYRDSLGFDVKLRYPDSDPFFAIVDELKGRKVSFHERLDNWDDGLRGFAVKDTDGYVTFFGRAR